MLFKTFCILAYFVENGKGKLNDSADFVERGVAAEGGEDAFLFEGEHTGIAGDFFDVVGIDVFDVATDELLNRFGDDELFHENGATRVAKGVFLGDDRLVKLKIVKIIVGLHAF